VTLSMAALALLTAIRVAAGETMSKKRRTNPPKKANVIWSRRMNGTT